MEEATKCSKDCAAGCDGAHAVLLQLGGGIGRLLSGLGEVLGAERFDHLIRAAGYEDAARDWERAAELPTFEAALAALADAARAEGWGLLRIVSLDRSARRARFRAEAVPGGSCPALSSSWGRSFTAGRLAGLCAKLFGVHCEARLASDGGEESSCHEFIVEPAREGAAQSLAELLAGERARGAEMARALERLAQEVEERKTAEEELKFEVEERRLVEENLKFEVEERAQMERELREQLRLILEQRDAIHRMSVPIIQVWDGVLALPVVGPLSSERAARMMDQLLTELVTTRSQYAILDLTGAELADAATAEHLLRILHAVELMGARALITGIKPAAAQAMISLGIDLGRITIRSNLREGLMECMAGARPRGLSR